MTERQQTEHDVSEQGATHRAMKRRGLIAGAAALVAGMVAKQSAQPVAADPQVWTMPYSSGIQNIPTDMIFLFNKGNGDCLDVGTNGGIGVAASSVTNNGVYGGSHGSDGVYGNTNAPDGSGFAGVFGIANGPGTYGVQGDGNGSGYGVYGSDGTIGVYGVPTSGSGYFGVRGDAGTPVGSAGLLGYSNTANGVAFGSVVVAPATLAGYFNGVVHVTGPFIVDNPANKHGAIDHADGSTRLVYSMESPESWIEDFGTGTLSNGKATVALDPGFAGVVHTDEYHVFLTGHDEHGEGLVVAEHRPDGFVVKERKGGTSSGTFSWRVVAKPTVGRVVERLPTYTRPVFPMPPPPPPHEPARPKKK